MRSIITFFVVITLMSCRNSEWEEIPANGIPEEPLTLNPIYFQDSLNGIIGGYKLVQKKASQNIDKLETNPVAYLTKNGGKKWMSINFDKTIRKGVDEVFLRGDTIKCLVDSILLRSNDSGLNWTIIEKSSPNDLRKKHFPNAYYPILNRVIEFENEKYIVKESYSSKNVEVIVCKGEKAMTDYYFMSRNNGKTWTFLQEDFGSNRRKFLLDDTYLFTYQSPYGLQKLKLK